MTSKDRLRSLIKAEDWWACWLGFALFICGIIGVIIVVPRPHVWTVNPIDALSVDVILSYGLLMALLGILFSIGVYFLGGTPVSFLPAFVVVSLLGLVAQVISKQYYIDTYGLEYVLWALIIGLMISNTLGVPQFLKPAIRTELYIKTGLVLLGAEILFSRILNLGIQGLILAWVVTPIVLYLMYRYGTTVLKMDKTLTVVIAAATSVCGVSAAIAVAAATQAKKEQLTLTISLCLVSTVIMLVGLPALIKAVGIDYIVGGAWIGGTVDSTGAVVAAGELLNQQAMEVATVVKLIQNVMIGVIAFVVAFLWVTKIDKQSTAKPGLIEVWNRFPKFVIAFLVLSTISSFVLIPTMGGVMLENILRVTGGVRTFLFAIAFLSIGLSSEFANLRVQIAGGKPVHLYIVGQFMNVVLTLVFAWALFTH